MKTLTSLLILTLASIMFVGCGPKPLQETAIKKQPDWYKNPPVKADYVYGTFSSTSLDMQLAIDKANAGACADIARQVEIHVKSLQKRFDEETGFGNNAQLLQQFTAATKITSEISLTGAHVKDKTVFKDGDNFRAYCLVEYPIGEANKALIRELKKNEILTTRLRSSEAFNELDKETQKEK